MQKISIKKFKKEHLKGVLNIIYKTFNKKDAEKARQNLIDTFDKSNKRVYAERYVVILNKKVIGICGLYRFHSHPKNLIGLAWFSIKPKYQGKGIGKLLLKFCINKAKKDKKKYLFVWTDSRAVNFYKKFGFKKCRFKILPKEAPYLLVRKLS